MEKEKKMGAFLFMSVSIPQVWFVRSNPRFPGNARFGTSVKGSCLTREVVGFQILPGRGTDDLRMGCEFLPSSARSTNMVRNILSLRSLLRSGAHLKVRSCKVKQMSLPS